MKYTRLRNKCILKWIDTNKLIINKLSIDDINIKEINKTYCIFNK